MFSFACLPRLVLWGAAILLSAQNAGAQSAVPGHSGSKHARQGFSGSLPPNPVITALLEQVSPDTLRSYLETLVGFHTRQSNSDTTSPTVGIGAARNWIIGRFQRFAEAAGEAASPSFFAFDDDICGIQKRHKNVLLTLTGAQNPDRYFIMSGHMDSRTTSSCDSTSFAPGANDDGSGTVATIEAARVMSRLRYASSLLFITFTGEEQGRHGSIAYARWARKVRLRIDGMITNDIVGNITGCPDNPACPPGEPMVTDSMSVKVFSQGPSTTSDRQFTRAMKLAARRYLPEFTVTLMPSVDRPWGGGDHQAFNWQGYTGIRFTEPNEFGNGNPNNGHRHNPDDRVEFINFDYLARVVRANIAGLANLALAPEAPQKPAVEIEEDGTLAVWWQSVLTAPDVAGYRIAVRGTADDSLFYFDIRDAGAESGSVHRFDLSGLDPDVPVYISVSAYDADYNESLFSPETKATPIITGVRTEARQSAAALTQRAANPMSGTTRIGYRTPAPGRVHIDVYDATGRLVARLVDSYLPAGAGNALWNGRLPNGRRAGSGMYFVRMTLDDKVIGTLKVMRVR